MEYKSYFSPQTFKKYGAILPILFKKCMVFKKDTDEK